MKRRALWVALLWTGLIGATFALRSGAADVNSSPDDPFSAGVDESAHKDTKQPQPRRSREADIQRALSESTSIEFVETPLSDVVEYLKDLHKLEIQLDTKVLENEGVGSDTPITRNIKGISLRSALKLMLGSLDLRYVIKNEVLLITSQKAADEMLETRIYDLSDIVASEEAEESPAERLQSLMETILKTIRPESWSKEAAAHACGLRSHLKADVYAIVVRQTFDGHEQIKALLAELRNLKAPVKRNGEK